jgi:hypothetical protein
MQDGARAFPALIFSAESAGSQGPAAAALLLAAQETRSRHFASARLCDTVNCFAISSVYTYACQSVTGL